MIVSVGLAANLTCESVSLMKLVDQAMAKHGLSIGVDSTMFIAADK